MGNTRGKKTKMAGYGAPPPLATGPGTMCSKVEIRIECEDLLNKDTTSKSDPCAVLMMLRGGKHWYEVGRTENIKNCLCPKFSKAFTIDYYFEEVQKLKIAVYDIDNATPELDDDDFLGQLECTLGQVVASAPYRKPLLKRNGHPAGKGKICVLAEELSGSNELLLVNFSAKNLDKKDTFGKSDPCLEFLRMNVDGSTATVHRTEVIKNTLNPQWRHFQMRTQSLSGGDYNRTLQVNCYDYDSDGSHDFIGGFNTTVNEMLEAQKTSKEWECINPKKQAKKKSYKNSGVIILNSVKLTKEHSFLDFIFSGLQINFTVGIDFTGSNGNPSSPNSLHYINPYAPNEYMQAISSVGAVCQDYDTDKMFPALGFGAFLPHLNDTSHEFAINFNPQNPFCAGVQGIVDAYKNCISKVKLSGPTNAAPIIHHVANFAKQAQQTEQYSYFVLLMLTDGILTDMNKTKEAIVYASGLPMSIIIVGVGGADFSDMQELDGDDGVLRSPSGHPVKRDIVQFIPFRQFSNTSAAELARHVLFEIPGQVTGYFKMIGMAPRPRLQ
ncbi:copine-3-like isoform X2 [Lineus longissimus]|uniref:copine-3-like isoform X2 n=1 Tax=Lineus longissimus TaxID=88925 RepID=UPI00315C537A